MTYVLADCHPEHIRAMHGRLRDADLHEIACAGLTAQGALWRSYRASILRRAAVVDGQVAAVWGCGGSALGGFGEPWLLTAPEVERVPVAMVKVGRQELRGMTEIFPVLQNFVAAEYVRACRFLELLGFRLDAAAPYGPHGMPFRRFWMEK